MTKKLQKYLAGIATGDKQYAYDGKYYILDPYRIAEMVNPLPGLEIIEDEQNGKWLHDWMRKPEAYDGFGDYAFCPASSEELKNGVREICGRKRTPVAWRRNETFPAINARWMAEALECLKADGFYVRGKQEPVYIYSDEEIWNAEIAVLILPVIGYADEGFFEIIHG